MNEMIKELGSAIEEGNPEVIAEKWLSLKKKLPIQLKIGFSEEGLGNLLIGKTFDLELDGINIHVFNSEADV